MPTYDYRCSACGRQLEVVHGIHDQGPATCESCGGAMRKALSTPAILFKGSGWAKKDAQTASRSRSAGGTQEAGSSANEAGSSAKDMSTGGASGSKPADGATAAAGKPTATSTSD